MASTAEMTELDIVEPNCRRFLELLNSADGPPIYTLSPSEARKVLEDASQADPFSGPTPKKPADIEDRVLQTPRGDVRVRLVRPKGNKSELPVVIFNHGGGWILGSKNTHDRLIRDLADGAQAQIVFIDYDRSPEAHYPTAIEQMYAGLKYVSEKPEEFNVDPKRIAIAGDSVGGNMTAALAMLAKQRGGPKISKQIMFYPVTNDNFTTGSYKQFGEGFFLTQKSMEWFWDAYIPEKSTRSQPTASPVKARIEDLRGLPPALITVNECDVLRDEGEDYARKLAAAGVEVTGVRMLGMTHDNLILGAITQAPGARDATELAITHLKKSFSG